MKKIILSTLIATFLLTGCGEKKEEMQTTTQIVQENTKEEIQKEVQKPIEKISDGKTLFAKCVSCHGESGEKIALNKSKIIQNLTKDEIIQALIGYKNGSYGGEMKGLMKGQVENLTEDDIKQIAEYLKK